MEYQKKTAAYQALIADVKAAYQSCPGGLRWCEDCKEINLWTYWQGRGNLNARILLVGQDWGNPWAPDAQVDMACIRSDNENGTASFIPNLNNPTDNHLVNLFDTIGYNIRVHNDKNRDLFFTNFVLGYREKGISGGFQRAWAKNDRDFFTRLVNIIHPEIILCLGKDTFESVISALPSASMPRIRGYNRFIESGSNPIVLPLPYGKTVRIFALAHCGRLGTLNRNRGTTNRDSLQKQLDDWKRIRK